MNHGHTGTGFFTQSYDPDGPNYVALPPVKSTIYHGSGSVTQWVDPITLQPVDLESVIAGESIRLGVDFAGGECFSQECRVISNGCAWPVGTFYETDFSPATNSTSFVLGEPYTEQDATDDLTDALELAAGSLSHDQMRGIVAAWIAENTVPDPERAPGVKPAITGLTETAPDMRYRGLGFCDEP